MSDLPQVTYKTEDSVYDVKKLSQEGQAIFNVIVECTSEMSLLRKRIAVLEAAVNTFNNQMQSHLTDDALIVEEKETSNEDS